MGGLQIWHWVVIIMCTLVPLSLIAGGVFLGVKLAQKAAERKRQP